MRNIASFENKLLEIEEAEDYKIFKIIQIDTGKEEYFIIFTSLIYHIHYLNL